MENILVIRHGALGDLIIVTGRILQLKEMYPNARFTMMTSSPFVGLVKQFDMFSEIIVDDRKSPLHIGDACRIIRAILAGKFSKVFDFQDKRRTRTYRSILRWLMPKGEMDWYTVRGKSYHISKTSALRCAKEEQADWTLPQRVTDLTFMHGKEEHFHLLPERYVLLIPGCSPQHSYKRWPVESYREIVRRLASIGIQAVIIGTESERAECDAICKDLPTAVNMVGLTQMADIPQVAHRALAVLGNDTGPTHMASFSRVHTIAVFDKRNSRSVMHAPDVSNFVSEDSVSSITPDVVWNCLKDKLR